MSKIVEIRKVSKQYRHEGRSVHALHGINLSVERGDVYGIVGLSGAGKSTLIRCLARLDSPSSGSILFKGNDIIKMKEKALREYRKNIGMVFQHFNLFSSRTLAKNVAYPLEIEGIPKLEQKKQVENLLKLVELQHKAQLYPSHLSGGEKQRAGIARALANHPEVLLCDEATSALDPKTTKAILDLLLNVNQNLGITIILISHEMAVIKQICNKVAVIEKGKIIEEGLVSDVFVNPKQPTTKTFLQGALDDIPDEFIKKTSPDQKLIWMRFKGKVASEPIISTIVRKFNIEANILLGWIDKLRTTVIGTLVIHLTGSPDRIERALCYLDHQSIYYEEIEK